MSAWWEDQTLVAFDTETTGVNVDTARIVTVHLGGADHLIDPGVEIPESASAIHGITTEYAAEHGEPPRVVLEQIERDLVEYAGAGVPVVAMNAAYDFSVLDREFRRCDEDRLPVQHRLRIPHGLYVIDPYVLDKQLDTYRRGKRTLTALCEHYGVELTDAHNAAADANAAVALARKMGEIIGERDLYVLHQRQVVWRWQQQESLQLHFESRGRSDKCDGRWPVIPAPKNWRP